MFRKSAVFIAKYLIPTTVGFFLGVGFVGYAILTEKNSTMDLLRNPGAIASAATHDPCRKPPTI